MENQLAPAGHGVDTLLQRTKPNLPTLQILYQRNQIFERSRLLLKLLHEHYHPTSAEAKLINLQSRVEQLEQRIFGTS